MARYSVNSALSAYSAVASISIFIINIKISLFHILSFHEIGSIELTHICFIHVHFKDEEGEFANPG